MKIRVEFVDVTGRHQLPTMDLEDSQLPSSFELDTTMHLGDLNFQVQSATPADFRKTGRLRLEMVPVERIDPKELLYSIRSLANRLPEVSGSWRPDCLELHEDDWRQIELVSASRRAEVERELASIRTVPRQGPGFKAVHLRLLEPGISLPLADLETAAPPARRAAGLAFEGVEGCVTDGFAWRTPAGLLVYGVAPQGRVTTLCLEPPGDSLEKLTQQHDLWVVDWCAATLVAPDRLADYQPGYTSFRRSAF